MRMYQFVVLTGLISTFSLLNFYDRWQYFNMGQRETDETVTVSKQDPSLAGPVVAASDQSQDVDAQKVMYLSKLYMALGEISEWYILKKDPAMQAFPLKVWKNAVFAKAEQEKMWEQFFMEKAKQKEGKDNQKKSKKLIYSSFQQLSFLSHNDKAAWRFVKLFIDGMENYYFFWKKAASSSCVPKGDVMARARAAFSSYNGGMSQMCRWHDAFSKVSTIDREFYQKMKQQSWKQYGIKKPVIEVAKNLPPKMISKTIESKKLVLPKILNGQLVSLPSKEVCIMKSGTLNCLSRKSDTVCLSAITKFKNVEAKKVKATVANQYKIKRLNRFETCENYNSELRPISSLIKTKKKINLRTAPGGKLLGVVPKGVILRVKDFKLESLDEKHAYYKVSFDGKKGYIYAGTEKTSRRWISTVSEKSKTGGDLAKLVKKFKDFLEL